MITFVNAKINLGLNIVGRRPDGYHNLETVFYPVGKGSGLTRRPGFMNDIIEVIPAETDGLEQKGFIADCPADDNLVMKSLALFRREALHKDVEVGPKKLILEKHIPFGAGLGGGSADASFTLLTLNNLYGNLFSEDELLKMANVLGADCPFFIINSPVFAEGTGDIISDVSLDLSDYWIAIVKPDISVSTRDAFSYVVPSTPEISLKEIIRMPVDAWKEYMVNDFENSVFRKYPELKKIKEHLYEKGAIYASMSGSGSSFYGIFKDNNGALDAASSAQCPFFDVSRL